jgi:uncharacterized protein YdhG (YjbR/CyaY superfamily)
MTKTKKKPPVVKPGGVSEYITQCPQEVRGPLKDIRAAIREAAPDAIETVSYFDMPGYSYEGYGYNGMFAWFSFKAPFVRLHVRPQAIAKHEKELQKYAKTRAIVSFTLEKRIPKTLVKTLVRASLRDMKDAAK